ncbi:MAG: RidA family protein [Chloroflexota bacterium]
MTKQHINPEALYDSSVFGMSQAVIDTTSGLVFVSGQVDWNHQLEVSTSSVEDQLQNALKNLRTALEAAGSSVDQLLHVRVYIRGELGEHMRTASAIVPDFLGESRPAITAIGVASLASPETLVEVEATARVN